MKRKLIFGGLVLMAFAVLQSCDRKAKLEEERKTALFKKLISTKDNPDLYPGGKIVPNELAQQCIDNYRALYKVNPSSEEIERAYTDNVMFGNKGLLKWMFDMADSTDVDNIRVFFGVYSDVMVKQYPNSNIKPGRLTVFLWPYNGNSKAVYKKWGGGVGDPPRDTTGGFDLGTLRP